MSFDGREGKLKFFDFEKQKAKEFNQNVFAAMTAPTKEHARCEMMYENAARIFKVFLDAFADPLYPRQLIKDDTLKISIRVEVSSNIFRNPGQEFAETIEALRLLIQTKLDVYSIQLGQFSVQEMATTTHGYLGLCEATLRRI